jgi:Domain of unknown function (DUF4158)
MKLPDDLVPDISPATLYRYYGVLREHLELNSQGKHARHVAAQAMHAAVQVMENPADLINAAIETLLVAHCELPAFSTLDRLAWRIRRLVNRGIYQSVFARIAEAEQQALSRLLEPDGSFPFTTFDRIKDAPNQPPSRIWMNGSIVSPGFSLGERRGASSKECAPRRSHIWHKKRGVCTRLISWISLLPGG